MSSLKDMITSNKMEWNNSTLILEVVVNFININVANKNEIEFNIGICKNEMQYAIQNSTDNIEYRLIYEILHSNIFDTYWMIIPGLSEPPVRTLRATIPENGSHIFR